MNYNCLQYDLALSVITQLPQHRAAKAPALLKWNHFRQEKANTQSQGNFVVQFVSVYVYVFNAYVYVYENKDESEYSQQLYLEPRKNKFPLEFQHLLSSGFPEKIMNAYLCLSYQMINECFVLSGATYP